MKIQIASLTSALALALALASAPSSSAKVLRGPICAFTRCVRVQKAHISSARSQNTYGQSGGDVPIGPNGGYTPISLQGAYGLTQLSAQRGMSVTVGIVIAHNDPTAESDLATWRAHYGMPPCTEANGCFHKIGVHGRIPTSTEVSSELEVSIDTDAISSLCPYCHIVLVEGENYSPQAMGAAELQAARAGARIINNSYVMGEPSWENGYVEEPQILHDFDLPGVAVVAGSGDWTYGDLGYPAALPFVTAVGGTTLKEALGTSRGWQEEVWNEGGESFATVSGCDSFDPKPPWQKDKGCKGRTVADISALANVNHGLSIYCTRCGGWAVAGGTSLASALVSAYYALVGGGAGVGGAQWDYAHAASLTPVTKGTDINIFTSDTKAGGSGIACAILYLCNAGPGYNGPTGVGSISGAVEGFQATLPLTPFLEGIEASSSDGAQASLKSALNPEGLPTSYHFACSAEGRVVSGPTQTMEGTQLMPITASIALPPNEGTSDLGWGCEAVAVNAAGTTQSAVTPQGSVAGFWQSPTKEGRGTAQSTIAPLITPPVASAALDPAKPDPYPQEVHGLRAIPLRSAGASALRYKIRWRKERDVHYLCSFSGAHWRWRPCKSGLVLSRLREDKHYLLYVLAKNANGYSSWAFLDWLPRKRG